ncbi:peptidase M16 [Spirochaetia bacterium]|nr:peptidase M16 [Spirochaetia bacterium]GHU29667.1 peptidase M16 [Spirochaetia bacterium]
MAHFEILERIDLPEFKAQGIWARHIRTGAEVFHLLNDDSENLFSFTFATAPEGSCGEAHILEHSVLCGSEHYPLKDSFAVLAHGSLQTYLNAWTFPDKTIYPASSTNETDYFNLMAVYADAVFHPLLTEWTFMQEGHRIEYNNSGKLNRIGVVYNEMKGAYSSMDAIVFESLTRELLPDTIYAFDSGGDPEHIPELTWEKLKAFHRSRYAPANCRIFLAGNIPTEQQLEFLDSRILADLPAGSPAEPIKKAARWNKARTVKVPCAAGSLQYPTVLLSWLCGDSTDKIESLGIDVLVEALLGHDGSPLKRALVESGLGEDIDPSSGAENNTREIVFSVGLRGVPGKPEALQDLILNTLKNLSDTGIPADDLEAALLHLEFSNREIKRSHGPYSLALLQRAMYGWLHGTKPWETLVFEPVMALLKNRLSENPRYFEALIKKNLLDNSHRLLLSVVPEEGYLEKKEAAAAEELARKEQSLTDEDRNIIRIKANRLAEIQSEPDTQEALATIPHLSRNDLKPDIERVPREIVDAAGVPVLKHDLWTNGIAYMDVALPVDVLEPEDYPWLPFFAKALTSVGLPGLDYAHVSGLFAKSTGSFYAMLVTGSAVDGSDQTIATPSGIFDVRGRDWLMLKLKALNEKAEDSFSLVYRILKEADFSDPRRIHDLMVESKNDLDSSIPQYGNFYASTRSCASCSRENTVRETWNGLSQIEFIHTLNTMDPVQVAVILTKLRDKLIARSGIIVSLTGSPDFLEKGVQLLSRDFSHFGPPRSRNPVAIQPESQFVPLIFSSQTLQVAFAALTKSGSSYKSREAVAELVLGHHLSTGVLWEEIRMKGGAYGASAYPVGLEKYFAFSTYRDPSPVKSLAVFRNLEIKPLDEKTLEQAIIGTFGGQTTPRTNPEKGAVDFLRLCAGIEDNDRLNNLKFLVSLTTSDLNEAINRIVHDFGIGVPVIISGQGIAQDAAKELGGRIIALPV